MIAMTLAQVAAAIGVDALVGPDAAATSVPVRSVEFDTRRIRPGALFVALRGERVDGHDYVAEAAAAGAVAVLGSRDITGPSATALPMLRVPDRPDNAGVLDALARLARASVGALIADHGLQVVGVTGSSGKTSTKDLIAAVLRAGVDEPAQVVAPPESFNNELGHPYTALRANETTRFLVLELSARGVGHIAALATVAPPRIGAVLNVGSAHLGEFGSVEKIAEAKSELVQALPAAAEKGAEPGAGGVAILNADDPLVAGMAGLTAAQVVLVGQAPSATVRAEKIGQDEADRARFTLVTPEGAAPVALRVVGAHQVGNALAAAAVGRAVGMPTDAVAAALSTAEPASKWRMDVTDLANGATLINDAYNANPHSMKAALLSLATIGRGRRTWAVLGEMAELGDDATEAHDRIGRLVVRLGIDRLLVVEGPGAATGTAVGGRTAPRALHLGAHLEGSWSGESELVADTDTAAEVLLDELEPGDVVLVKASRSVGLERVALRLIDSVGVATGGVQAARK